MAWYEECCFVDYLLTVDHRDDEQDTTDGKQKIL
jgi:hypothetical protein